MPWDDVNLFQLEAKFFKDSLVSLVEKIYNSAIQELDAFYAKAFADLQAAATRDQAPDWAWYYKCALESEKEEQVRALATMALAMLGALMESFLNQAKARMYRTHPPTKKRYPGKSKLHRQIAEYKERFGIDTTTINGFAAVQQVILARNSCLHKNCVPEKDYLEQTDGKLLDDDKKINLTPEQLRQFVVEISEFADDLYKSLDNARALKRQA